MTAVQPATAGSWEPPAPAAAPAAAPGPSVALRRALSALRRYKWAMLPIVIVGTAAGVVATRFIAPEYEVQATINIAAETPMQESSGPMNSQRLLSTSAWTELLRSYRISDAVVRKMGLFVAPASSKHDALFRSFALAERFRPGEYSLASNKAGRWTLSNSLGTRVDEGALGDSIGRELGFLWAPPAALVAESGDVGFTVQTPREASVALAGRLVPSRNENSNFLRLTLRDRDPARAAAILNVWVAEFVKVAADLKRYNLTEFANILGDQLEASQTSLTTAEGDLERFKVNTITLPSADLPVQGGTQEARETVLSSYFTQRFELDNISRDREALARAIAVGRGGGALNVAELLSIPSIARGEAAADLRGELQQLSQAEAQLRAARLVYTDEFKAVRDLEAAVRTFEQQTIPRLAGIQLAQLQQRESDLQRRLAGASSDLKSIPQRTIEEQRLIREVVVRGTMYTALKQRHSQAKLAEASSVPDLVVLDSAVAPLQPTSNTAPRLILMGLLGSLGLAVLVALLLDRVDGYIRYPEQATNDLGLTILGAVPTIRRTSAGGSSPEEAAQVVEAFRSIRLNVRHAYDAGPMLLTITSPGAAEGKSLISSNLALSFAEAGYRTCLVDGDTRRGALHASFGVPQSPGLIDYLSGTAHLSQISLPTLHDKLVLVPCGARRRQGPELLSSATMTKLVNELKRDHDVVIFDTPPLGAGIDAFALGTITGHMVLVLRIGVTERRMAEAKLALLDRLPVQLLGTVLNAVKLEGEYQYYGYLDGYSATDDAGIPRLTSEVGGDADEEDEAEYGRDDDEVATRSHRSSNGVAVADEVQPAGGRRVFGGRWKH